MLDHLAILRSEHRARRRIECSTRDNIVIGPLRILDRFRIPLRLCKRGGSENQREQNGGAHAAIIVTRRRGDAEKTRTPSASPRLRVKKVNPAERETALPRAAPRLRTRAALLRGARPS